jgi:antitoxin CptB
MESAERARLLWQCRRGMRELDLLLQAFAEAEIEGLDATEKAAFEGLLARPDAELAELLLGASEPMDGTTADVVARIRTAARP